MTRDPRAEWDGPEIGLCDDDYIWGAEDRLTALLPQLEAADALADAVQRRAPREVLQLRAAELLELRDAHLTEGEPA